MNLDCYSLGYEHGYEDGYMENEKIYYCSDNDPEVKELKPEEKVEYEKGYKEGYVQGNTERSFHETFEF